MSANQARANRPSSVTTDSQPLAGHVRESLERYFGELKGPPPCDLYDLFLAVPGQPLPALVIAATRG